MRVDPHYLTNLTQSLNSSQLAEQTLTQQLSSGLRVVKLSDDPAAAAQNVLLSSSISRSDSYISTATNEQGTLQVTDSTLGQVISDVTSAISLATAAGNGTLTATNLGTIAAQVSSIRDSVVAQANTSYQGQYLFSGSKGDTAPYVLDTSTNPATAAYQGDTSTQSVTTPQGQSIQTNLPGSTIFSAPGADLLGSLNQLVSDLNSGNTAAVAADTGTLSKALTNVTTQRSVLGNSLSQITGTSSYASSQVVDLEAQQSTLLSSNPATIATDLQSNEVQSQALLAVIASLSKSESLFDALH
jgi:flagellar hook-associated protein 3 FlgL